MASWMVHLRMADRLLSEIPGLDETAFIMGNMAPDSGVPNEDWSHFTPSIAVSHFQNKDIPNGKHIDISAFAGRYFTKGQRNKYDSKQYSFFLGYLCHLLTDIAWADQIFLPSMEKFAQGASDRNNVIAAIKEDWYDLDYLYLREHPAFRAFQRYRNLGSFPNTFMTEFPTDAFDNRRAYIVDFYLQENDHLDREYPYLTAAQADEFVEKTVSAIKAELSQGNY